MNGATSSVVSRVHALGSFRAWIVWFLAANCFFYAFFQRASPSVMVDPLMAAFDVGAAVTGNLAALYLYVYAVLQLPIGLLLDRWGPRILLAGGMALIGVGAIAFAMAPNIWVAYAGRFLIGAGSAVSFISVLTVASAWHSPSRFGLFSGLTMGYAMLGGFLAQGPLGGLIDTYGWREPILISGIWGAVLALLIWLIVRDRPDGQRVIRTGTQSLGTSLKLAMTRRQNWVLGFYSLLLSGPFLAYGLLWGVPHIMLIHGVDRETAGFSTSLMTVGFAFGGPIGGFLSDFFRRRKLPLMNAAFFSVLIWVAMLYGFDPTLLQRQVMIFLVGLFGGSMIVCLAAARELSPPSIGGAVTGFVNGMFVGGGALLQPAVGIALDLSWSGAVSAKTGVPIYSIADYNTALLVLPVSVGLGALLSLFIQESHCKPMGETE
ncbi:MAG: MFS transporter [Minwuia sp.]|nr:MFS transporter [Minwuia sp.]